ncbi:MAG: iron ABC transporter permease [Agarilytica sp.]
MILSHRQVSHHWGRLRWGILFVSVLVVLVSLRFGAVSIDLTEVFSFLVGASNGQTEMIIGQLRLPRALLAMCVGALLACCGAVTQGLFRNPLADPSLIGVSAGAAAGASLVIVLLDAYQWSWVGLSLVSFGAFAGGMVAVVFVYRIATGPTGTSVATMLLAGIAVTFLAGSISSVFEFVADNEMLRRISLWRMGGLEAADYSRVIIISVVCIAVLILLPAQYKALNAMLLGESEARHLGIQVDKVKRNIVVIVAAGVGVSVALAGTISFIGLVVPHIVRFFVGPNHRYLIPISACLGGVLLVIADAFSRTIIAPTELPVGLVTAFIGAPVFISLLRQRHRYGMQ